MPITDTRGGEDRTLRSFSASLLMNEPFGGCAHYGSYEPIWPEAVDPFGGCGPYGGCECKLLLQAMMTKGT